MTEVVNPVNNVDHQLASYDYLPTPNNTPDYYLVHYEQQYLDGNRRRFRQNNNLADQHLKWRDRLGASAVAVFLCTMAYNAQRAETYQSASFAIELLATGVYCTLGNQAFHLQRRRRELATRNQGLQGQAASYCEALGLVVPEWARPAGMTDGTRTE